MLAHPITLHHRDDIYFVVLATILLHNIIVEERMKNDEMEDGAMYNTNINDAGHSSSNENSTEAVDKQDQGSKINPVDC